MSRTKNVVKNIYIGFLCQILGFVSGILNRTFLIKYLGIDYLGVDGLFSNILTILSFAELGIGHAIIFSMYKPLAENNQTKIKSLMLLYKKSYTIIAVIVAIIGCSLIPFLDSLINGTPDIKEDITLIYVLFLISTVSSYFFVYKSSIISANQQNYKVIAYTQTFQFLRTIFQIVFLLITRAYIVYLVIHIVSNILCNMTLAIVADKSYPYLKEKAEPLSKDETRTIFKNVKALIVYKFGSVILNGTDNVLISKFVGLGAVGALSNFTLLSGALNLIISKITDAFIASIGNLNATSNSEAKYSVFKKILFLSIWIFGFASIGLVLVSNNILEVWLGEKYTLVNAIIIASVLHFYIKGTQFAAYTYRITLGYFVQGKIAPLLAAIINIILSIYFAKLWGTAGILFATSVARILTTGLIDPILVYKKSFNINPVKYYIRYIFYFIVILLIGILCNLICNKILINGVLGIIIKSIVISVLYNGLMVLIFINTKEFRELVISIKNIIKRK